MISVTKKEEHGDDELGIQLVAFEEGEIYVSNVDRGPFYPTGKFRQFFLQRSPFIHTHLSLKAN